MSSFKNKKARAIFDNIAENVDELVSVNQVNNVEYLQADL